MSDYQPSVGEHFTATSGAFVCEQVSSQDFGRVIRARKPDDPDVYRFFNADEYTFERVAPPLPTTPESVLRYHGHTFLLHEDGFWRDGCDDQCQLGTAVTGDQVEVIFDAGAER